jgi:AcrR family transcriptional regulator
MTDATVRSARGARTRGRILDAAQELFVTPGYRLSSLRDIAAAAGLSHQGVQRHFASKAEILMGVVERYEEDNRRRFADAGEGHGLFVDIARFNADRHGYLELFSALTGEATAEGHPAHERMSARYAGLRALTIPQFTAAQAAGEIGAGRDIPGETVRLAAAWDGLQLLQLYVPDVVQVVPALERHERLLATPYGWGERRHVPEGQAPTPVPSMGLVEPREPGTDGYAKGRERREQIVRDASALFAAEGYGDTSMRDIAERVGVSKSTLFHHYATKEDLLQAVLVARDTAISDRSVLTEAASAADLLRVLPEGAAANARNEPGLVELYAVLSCEAAAADHPAHAYYERRFRSSLDAFTRTFEAAQRDGVLPVHRDPAHEAAWLIALWDGLQFQWLYDREGVDVAAHLEAHLRDVLPD